MATLVRTEWFWKHFKNATRGVGARRERTRPEQFLTIKIPMPDIKLQKLGQQLFTKMELSKHIQAQTTTELDAMLPSILDKAFKGEL
jgi:type I restriction enzyme S subunit